MKKSFKKRIALLLLPLITVGAFHVSNDSGFITGSASSTNGDSFPVIVEYFNIQVSDPIDGVRAVDVSIPIKRITTENWMRDVHMKMSIFDNKYKTITFKANTRSELKNGSVSLDGVLTINGIEKSHQLVLSIHKKNHGLTISGATTVSLERYEISPPGMGPMKVNDKVEIELKLDIPNNNILS
ncbi:MAG: YceI family protein [Candidatus Marinimicrobia bacterium]|nr:YceI family protein [Candidatus Neomarinimicrobiota bacterium]